MRKFLMSVFLLLAACSSERRDSEFQANNIVGVVHSEARDLSQHEIDMLVERAGNGDGIAASILATAFRRTNSEAAAEMDRLALVLGAPSQTLSAAQLVLYGPKSIKSVAANEIRLEVAEQLVKRSVQSTNAAATAQKLSPETAKSNIEWANRLMNEIGHRRAADNNLENR